MLNGGLFVINVTNWQVHLKDENKHQICNTVVGMATEMEQNQFLTFRLEKNSVFVVK